MLVAGPNVAQSQMEPHEFFHYTSGQLDRQFIRSEEDFLQRMRESEEGMGPDGRFRIHEFFCHDDTWRYTVAGLLNNTVAVLMDLRGFYKANQGCLFEIEELLHLVPVQRILLLVDKSTEQELLNRKIQEVWAKLPISSINANKKKSKVDVYRGFRTE